MKLMFGRRNEETCNKCLARARDYPDYNGTECPKAECDGQLQPDPYFAPPGVRFPTLGHPPQKTDQVQEALIDHDWRRLNRLGVRWYDEHARRWFQFGPRFWDLNSV